MRLNGNNLDEKHKQIIESKQAVNIIYLFEIFLASGEVLYLNSSGDDILLDHKKFSASSGLNITRGEFNDSAENIIEIHGIFSQKAISKKTSLNGCKIKIYHYLNGKQSPLVTYFITEFQKNDLDFNIKCEPEVTKYNQSIVLLFSKTCRANFGDEKCGINIDLYKKKYQIKSLKDNIIYFTNINQSNGYYNLGYVIFKNQLDKWVKFKILSHYNNKIETSSNISNDLMEQNYAILVPACDKTFITCCNKFNNAVNFRGEPTINEHNFLKNAK